MSYTITPRYETDGTLVLQYKGDAQNLVDHCAESARDYRERPSTRTPNRRRLMSVPPEVMMDVAHKHGIDYRNTEAIWKILMDRDYSKFRTIDSGKPYRNARRSSVVAIRR